MNLRRHFLPRLGLLFFLGANLGHAQLLTRFVDPFIGTSGGGNTFPGALRPWGMASVSPHTDLGVPSGYSFGSRDFFGLGHNHLSGTGCADLGSVIVAATESDIDGTPASYRSTPLEEFAEPGYYRVRLSEPSLLVEATATERCGFIRFTAHAEKRLRVILDAGRSLALVGGGQIRINAPDEVEGFNISGGFCGESNRATVYFVAQVNQASVDRGTWYHREVSRATVVSAIDTSVGAWMTVYLPRDSSLLMKVGLSYVSIENARFNLEREIAGWDFDAVKREAQQSWERQLSTIIVEDTSTVDKTKFYTALYHTLIHPSIVSDVNGEYARPDRSIGRSTGRPRYSVYSLWDTYRTLHPFLSLVYPERQSDMVKSMIDMGHEFGHLPKWELLSNETFMMVGDPSSIVIADTYLRGIRDFDVEGAFRLMMRSASGLESSAPSRPGYADQLRLGFIPVDQDTTQEWWTWGPVSTMLEYCLADWSISRLALALGKDDDAKEFSRRSLGYRHLHDTTTQLLRPRLADGRWLPQFDPEATEGSGSWPGSGGPGYVEGNAWNYAWFVPHDVSNVIDLNGGMTTFASRLESYFQEGRFTATNEPDLAYPYLFTYVPGQQARTQQLIPEIMSKRFGIGPAGLPGNDDCGTISAWFVFSALGLYPACPADESYRLGIPLFSRIRLRLNKRYYADEELIIERKEFAFGSKSPFQAVFRNEPLHGYQIRHSDIVRGGILHFVPSPAVPR